VESDETCLFLVLIFICFLYFFITVGGHKEVITTPEIYELQAPF
jgi:hypothetical protein